MTSLYYQESEEWGNSRFNLFRLVGFGSLFIENEAHFNMWERFGRKVKNIVTKDKQMVASRMHHIRQKKVPYLVR